MIKALFSTSVLVLTMIGHASGQVYDGPDQGNWADPENWDLGFRPAVDSGGEGVINNGATVLYDAAELGDLKIDFGGRLTISNGSTWLQSGTTHWTQINHGTLVLDNGSLHRGIGGYLVGSWAPGSEGAPVVSEIIAKNGSEIQVGVTDGNFILGFTNYTTSTLELTDSSVQVAGELWLGSNTVDDANQIVTLNIANSSITTRGVVGLWVWDYAAAGNSVSINFSGDAGSYIEVADSIGMRADATGADNQATWESLWSVGVLTAFGQSGLTGAFFEDYFTTEGTSAREGAISGEALIPYRLILQVPEPSAGLLLIGSAASLLGMRRRRG